MWAITLILTIAAVVMVLLLGTPVALGFLTVTGLLALILVGFPAGGIQVVGGIESTLGNYSLLPIPMFVLMGELLFQAGLAGRAMNGIALWLGRLPGKMALVNVGTGTMFAMFSGSAVATTSTVGKMVLPEMARQGYDRRFSMGSILGAGGLAAIIPPSSLAVLVGTIGGISVGGMIIGGLLPGILLALLLGTYIVLRAKLQPHLTPTETAERPSWRVLFRALVRDILPLSLIMILMLVLITTGIATPTESAALGALGALILAVILGKMTMKRIVDAFVSTIKVACAILLIIAGAAAYSQMLAYSGAVRGLIDFAVGAPVAPIMIIILMLIVVFLLGSPLEPVSIMLITLPIFMPIVLDLGFHPVWFGVMFLIMIDVANLTPPLGLQLFALGSVAPPGTRFGELIRAAFPVILVELTAIAILLLLPIIATFLPDLALYFRGEAL